MKRLLMYVFLATAVVVPSAAWAAEAACCPLPGLSGRLPLLPVATKDDEPGWNASNGSSSSAA